MTVGELIEWCAPNQLDYFMRHLNQVWYEQACLNQLTLCEKLELKLDVLHELFNSFDKEHTI